jgi:hypothetical protein
MLQSPVNSARVDDVTKCKSDDVTPSRAAFSCRAMFKAEKALQPTVLIDDGELRWR